MATTRTSTRQAERKANGIGVAAPVDLGKQEQELARAEAPGRKPRKSRAKPKTVAAAEPQPVQDAKIAAGETETARAQLASQASLEMAGGAEMFAEYLQFRQYLKAKADPTVKTTAPQATTQGTIAAMITEAESKAPAGGVRFTVDSLTASPVRAMTNDLDASVASLDVSAILESTSPGRAAQPGTGTVPGRIPPGFKGLDRLFKYFRPIPWEGQQPVGKSSANRILVATILTG